MSEVEGVGQFTIDQPKEEVHRQLVEDFEFINWTHLSVNDSYTLMHEGELFSIDTVTSGLHKTDVIYRTDVMYSEDGIQAIKEHFGVSESGATGEDP